MLDIKCVTNMKKRIFYSITGVTILAICIFSIFITTIMYNQLIEQAKKNIKNELSHIKQVLLSNNANMNNITSPNRVTIIRNDGKVLFDNVKDYTKMNNHLNRPEIIALQHSQYGENIRLSDTLAKQTYYYAVQLDNNNILRMAISIDSIYLILLKTMPYFIITIILIIIISSLISKYLTQKIIAPLYNINEQAYDELELFYKKIKSQQKYIENQKVKLEQKTEEFKMITENIANGLILLNTNSEIISINKTAIKILGKENTDYIFKNIIELNRSYQIRQGIQQAFEGENCEIVLEIKNKQYILHIAPVKNNSHMAGIVILIVDNTKKAEAETIRREFSANVSHELKTPLTSISGYAELIMGGIVKQKDIQKFAEKIYCEAQKLISLIQDIIKISKLDEQELKSHESLVNLQDLITGNIARLEILAQEKNVKFEVKLDNIAISGIKSVLDEVFYNILENAIKYNVYNGKITVELIKIENKTLVYITDTGIGIPKDCIHRIFERFYRVDTSHSKSIAGTGIGLAIVKHAINLHNGEIHVHSEVAKGTKFTICFK